MAAFVAWFLLAAVVGWVGVIVWLTAKGEMHFGLEDLRTYWRLHVFAWLGVVAMPLLVAYIAVKNQLSVGGVIVAALAWLGFGLLLRWVRRPPARRDAAGGDTPKPS